MPTKPVAYRRLTASERKQTLVNAAIKCLGRGGMPAFTIEQICKEAGVSIGLINHHFKSKNDLLFSVYDYLTSYLTEFGKISDPKERIKQIINSNFDEETFDETNLRAWFAVWGQVANNPELSKLHRLRYGEYRRQIEAAIAEISHQQKVEINPKSITRNLIALIDGLWLKICLHPDDFSLQVAREDCYEMLGNYID